MENDWSDLLPQRFSLEENAHWILFGIVTNNHSGKRLGGPTAGQDPVERKATSLVSVRNLSKIAQLSSA
jgi:hypothetical protein